MKLRKLILPLFPVAFAVSVAHAGEERALIQTTTIPALTPEQCTGDTYDVATVTGSDRVRFLWTSNRNITKTRIGRARVQDGKITVEICNVGPTALPPVTAQWQVLKTTTPNKPCENPPCKKPPCD